MECIRNVPLSKLCMLSPRSTSRRLAIVFNREEYRYLKKNHGLICSKQFKDEGGAGRGRDRLQLLLKEQGDVNLDDVKKYDDADDADSGDDLDSSDSDDDSDDDEEALEKELEKIRKEREEARKKKV